MDQILKIIAKTRVKLKKVENFEHLKQTKIRVEVIKIRDILEQKLAISNMLRVILKIYQSNLKKDQEITGNLKDQGSIKKSKLRNKQKNQSRDNYRRPNN